MVEVGGRGASKWRRDLDNLHHHNTIFKDSMIINVQHISYKCISNEC